MNRRNFINQSSKAGLSGLMAAGIIPYLAGCSGSKKSQAPVSYPGDPGFDQRPLPYRYGALSPEIDAQTMEIHYSRHAAGYSKLLKEAANAEGVSDWSLGRILSVAGKYSEKLRNNAGGHYNHELFWRTMSPAGKKISSSFQGIVENQLRSMGDLQNNFTQAAIARFGSGWAWLVLTPQNTLAIGSTPNQDNPLMDVASLKGFPLLGLDVWEHAYYLKYQNKRADYINAWWNLVNWEEVEARYKFAIKNKYQ